MVQQLFVRHEGELKVFVLAFHPVGSEADEVMQEVFLTIARKAGEFTEGSSFVAWARQIAKYKILEEIRRKNSAPRGLSEDVIEALTWTAPEELYTEDQVAAVQACICKLAPSARSMIEMRYRDELQPEEIARRTSWTVAAVNSALTKARAALRACVSRHLSR
jgi:RNA polymerase sigma-70 factor (ECF subfamily)